MIITRGSDGIYCAAHTFANKPRLGFSPVRQEAIEFCLEIISTVVFDKNERNER